MRTLFTLLFALMALPGMGKNTDTYLKLCEVNKCWTEQNDVAQLQYPVYDNRTEKEWIRTHLQLVEQTLRNRNAAHLSAGQKANRVAALDELNKYWQEGNFPVNDLYNYRTPIFIDRYDNFCAVGYLVKATGHEEVSRMIAANTNLAYVRQMNYAELDNWARDYGFTKDELAWIQPGYPPATYVKPVGGGTDGEIVELYADKAGERLYIGGQFSNVDNNIPADNIAYITEQDGNYTWHAMGDGLDGIVNAIVEFEGKIYAAGSFTMSGSTQLTNVAWWDGSKWNATGCIGGEVKDLIVFNDELYAVGDFDVCAAMSEVNFAKWNGTVWTGINMLEGHVNTVHNTGTELILGGMFSYMGNAQNIIKWHPVNGFLPYSNAIQNEVNDIEIHKGVVFAATAADIDSTRMIMKLDATANTWTALYQMPFETNTERIAAKVLCKKGNELLVGGDFKYESLMQPSTSSSNCAAVWEAKNLVSYDGILVDSTINAMAMFKGGFFVGGKFNTGYTGNSSNGTLNSIARWTSPAGVPTTPTVQHSFELYPNPATESITIKNNFGAKYFNLYEVSGRVALSRQIDGSTVSLALIGITPGTYMAEIVDDTGNKTMQKLVIR